MIKIGITGGIGSGKSVVAQLFTVYGVPVYTADVESKRITATSPVIRERLAELFGDNLYDGNVLNKKRLAEIIFSDRKSLEAVNSIIHPEVIKDFNTWAERLDNVACCAMESAILFENGLEKTVDVTLMVYAPMQLRLKRVALRDGTSDDEIRHRMNSQWSDERKRDLADFVVYNDDVQALIPQVEQVLSTISH